MSVNGKVDDKKRDVVREVALAIHRVRDPDMNEPNGDPWMGDAKLLVAAMDAYNGKVNPRDAVRAWQPDHAYVSTSNGGRGDYVKQITVMAVVNERVFRCTTPGRSGRTEPAWQLAPNATTVDGGTLVWTECTAEADAYGKVGQKDDAAKADEAAKAAAAKAEAAKVEADKAVAEAEAARIKAAEAAAAKAALTPVLIHPSEMPPPSATPVAEVPA
jgi:hypothetical protein